MPRGRREKYEHSIYHIMVRGNNQQSIFLDEEDRIQYLKRLKRYKERFKLEIYAYCLMTNHVHLLIYDNGQDISKVMQGLNLSYVMYFNKKYNRSGHLFQDRFKSVMAKQDSYFVGVSKYIHLNPVKANIVERAQDYKWSSMSIYLGERDIYQIIDSQRVLEYFSKQYSRSLTLYLEYIYDKDVEEEIATTIQEGHVGVKCNAISQKIEQEKLLAILCRYFDIHQLQLLKKNNKIYHKQRDLCIYIMALVGKISYKTLAPMFYVKPPAITESIKRAINLMIQDTIVLEQVNALIKEIA